MHDHAVVQDVSLCVCLWRCACSSIYACGPVFSTWSVKQLPRPHAHGHHQSHTLALLPCSVGRHKRELAEMCVKAVLAVADLERRDVNLDLIKVCRVAGSVGVINRSQMEGAVAGPGAPRRP